MVRKIEWKSNPRPRYEWETAEFYARVEEDNPGQWCYALHRKPQGSGGSWDLLTDGAAISEEAAKHAVQIELDLHLARRPK